jgi:hypothetical protein
VILQQEQREELLIELKGRILRRAVRKRCTRPPAGGALRGLEQPVEESIDHGAHALVARREREQHSADVIRVARPDERKDLVISEYRDSEVVDA